MKDQATILVIEDDPADGILLRGAFTKANIPNPVWFVTTAEEAVAYLTGKDEYQNRVQYPLPSLLLLDLNLPGMSGHGFLAWLRAQPGLNPLPVVVLSGSDDMRAVNLAHQLGANSFLVKPTEFESLVHLCRSITGYWLGLAQTPEVIRPLYDLSQPTVTIGG